MSRRASAHDTNACVAELVDALASGASVRKNVEVQVLSSAPINNMIYFSIALKL